MAASTYSAIFRRVRPAPLRDGLCALFNGAADARETLKIRRITATPCVALPALAVGLPLVRLRRAASLTGGAQLAVAAHNPSATPASVVDSGTVDARSYPDNVTSLGSVLRELSPATAGAANGLATLHGWRVGKRNTRAFEAAGGIVEPITLADGDSLAFQVADASIGFHLWCSVTLSVGSSSYVVVAPFAGAAPEQVVLAIMADGGDVVVRRVDWFDAGDAQGLGRFRVALVDGLPVGLDDVGAVAVTPTPYNPAAPALPAGVEAKAGPFKALLAGGRAGAPIDWDTTHGTLLAVARQHDYGTLMDRVGQALTGPRCGPGAAAFLGHGLRSRGLFDIYRAPPGGEGIDLAPGRGLALLAGGGGVLDATALGQFDVEVVFTYEAPSVGGGSTGYARSRVVNV